MTDVNGETEGAGDLPPPIVPDGAEPQPEMAPFDPGDAPEMPGAGLTDLG